ncbi:FAD-dependent oxidoreductase [Mesorhizobium sp. KR2-14]|uniref:FAD-dependent oxidoreductase n=1 Tax=Mesorhizobium sp. KR2-14 TaxID=3156610 RepID=UPI0032B3C814
MDASGIAEGYDLIVLGSGAAGLSAAVTAASHGLKVLVAEKEAHFGGASAISGGTIWIPGNRQASEAKLDASLATARTYLTHMIGEGADLELVDAFLQRGGEALAFLEENSELKFKVRPFSPDYHMELEGSSDGGRALEVLEYDGSRLGDRFRELRKPPEGMLLFGGMMVNRADVQHFLNARRSWASLKHCLKLLARYAKDRISHERGTRLVVGNALIARLARSAFDLGVDLRTGLTVSRLIEEDGQICGVVVRTAAGERQVRARAGVVLATGGFGALEDASRWRPQTDASHRSMSPAGNIGDGMALAIAAGAVRGEGLVSNFYWAPVSVLTHEDGSEEKFPHLVTDRAKPGIIAVNRCGRRFVNEADSYHRFVLAMQADPEVNSPCHLVCDSAALSAYGMGLARPAPVSNKALVKSGYLIEAASIGELAERIGVDPIALTDTIERYNACAARGDDPEFGRGTSSYNRSMGDPDRRPNPCLGPIRQAPFYAVRLVTGDLGSATGIRTDANARALDGGGRPIPGLYAAGNDMNSIMNGTYPGPGITLGPALTFGYLAALDAVSCVKRSQ